MMMQLSAEEGMDYRRRERLKAQASAILKTPICGLGHSEAALFLIEAHYWRARQALQASPAALKRQVLNPRRAAGDALNFDVYIRHWLWANGERLLTREIMGDLANEWGYMPQQHQLLPLGASIYRLELLRALTCPGSSGALTPKFSA